MKFSKRHLPERRGFTVSDSLIAVAALMIVVAIILPAIQDIRESARNTICQHRLESLALDSHLFETVNGRLPSQLGAVGVVEWEEWSTPSGSLYWAFRQSTSPLAEVQNLFEDFNIDPIYFDFDSTMEPDRFYQNDGWLEYVEIKQPRFRCGSSLSRGNPSQGVNLVFQSLYFPGRRDAGIHIRDFSPNGQGLTDFLGILGAGASGDERPKFSYSYIYRGIITSRELRTSDQVNQADGMSNTLMYGETAGDRELVEGFYETTYANSWASGGVGQGRGFVRFNEPITEAEPLLGNARTASSAGFGSFHPDTVNFVKGDGGICPISRTIDRIAYYQLCGAFDASE